MGRVAYLDDLPSQVLAARPLPEDRWCLSGSLPPGGCRPMRWSLWSGPLTGQGVQVIVETLGPAWKGAGAGPDRTAVRG